VEKMAATNIGSISIFNAQNFGQASYDYFLTFAAIGFGIALAINIIRYMLTYVAADERTRQITKGNIAASIASSLLVFSLVIILTFIEEQIPAMFGKDGYSSFIDSITNEINSIVDKTNPIINNEIAKLAKNYRTGQVTRSIFGVEVYTRGCPVTFAGAFTGQMECLQNQQKAIALSTAMINVAFDTQVALIVGKTLFEFFVTRAAAFLLGAGLAYYAFDPTRSAGAAMIATALGAYYVYPVAYEAFFSLPSPPQLVGAEQEMINIESAQYCGLTTIPSAHLEKSSATISLTLANLGKEDKPEISLATGSLIGFLNSLYLAFLLKHGAALAVTFIFINNTYV